MSMVVAALISVGFGICSGVWIVQEFRETPGGRFYPDDTTLAEVAWVQGGRTRAIDAWLADLFDGGWLELDGQHVRKKDPSRAPAYPADQERQDALSSLPEEQALTRKNLEDHWAYQLDNIQTRLEGKGLIARAVELRAQTAQSWGILAAAAAAALWWFWGWNPFAQALAGFGVATFVLGGWWKPDRLTWAGQQHRRHWQDELVGFWLAPEANYLGEAVAAGGLKALINTPLDALMRFASTEESGWEPLDIPFRVSWRGHAMPRRRDS